MDRGAWEATVHRLAKVGHDRATNTFSFRGFFSHDEEALI